MDVMFFKVLPQFFRRLWFLIKRFDLSVVQIEAIAISKRHLLEIDLSSTHILNLGHQLILPHQ